MKIDVYVRLLGESTVVYRPVPAQKIKERLYKIEGSKIYDSDDEEWEFLPESIVIVQEKELEGELVLVAIKEYST